MSSLLRFIQRKPSGDLPWEELHDVEILIHKGDFQASLQKLDNIKSGLDDVFKKNYFDLIKLRVFAETGDLDDFDTILESVVSEQKEFEHPVILNLLEVEKANKLRVKGELQGAVDLLTASETELQSLKSIYPTHWRRNTIRKNIVQSKSFNRMAQFDKSINLLTVALELLEELGEDDAKAEPFNTLGITYAQTGDSDNGLKYMTKSLDIYSRLGNKQQSLKLYNNVGTISLNLGKLDDALDNFTTGLSMSRELNVPQFTSVILLNIGLIYLQTGKLEESLVNFEDALKVVEELNNEIGIAEVKMNIGRIYGTMGDFTKCLKYYKEAQEIFEKKSMDQELAILLSNTSAVYLDQGFHARAYDLINKAIDIYERLGNNTFLSYSFLTGIQIAIGMNKMEDAEKFMEKLEAIKDKTEGRMIDHLYKLSKAYILLESDRVVKQAEAQTLLQEIADDEIINQEYTVTALLKLGELLLRELKISASEEALQEFKNLINRLESVTKQTLNDSSMKPTTIKVLLLQSKLALIDLEIEKAQSILDEAEKIAKDGGLKQHAKMIKEEKEAIKNEMMKYKKMVDTNASLYERLQESQIENYLKRAESILKK